MAQIQETFLFQPTSVTGCQLWLDAADPNGTGVRPGNGTTIGTWTDKSGNGNNCTNSTASNSPVYFTRILNNLPVLSFTGPGVLNTTTSQWLDNTTMTFPSSRNTIFALVYNDNSTSKSFTANNYIISARADFLLSYSSYTSNLFATFVGSGSSWNDLNTNTPSQNMNGVWAITGMTMNTNILTPYYNGTALNTKTGTMGSTTGFILGEAPAGFRGQCWNGYMAEILIFNVVLSTTQRQQVEGYLAWKWGLQTLLPTTHPFRNYRPLAQTPIPPQVPNMPIVTQGVQGFDPRQISGCQLWLDASDRSTVILSGSSVIQWRDKSVNSNHFQSAGLSTSPTTSTYNGLQTIYWTGTTQQLTSTNNNALTGNAARSIFVLIYNPLTTSCVYMVTGTESGATNATAYGFGKNANSDYVYPFLYSAAGADLFTFVQITSVPTILSSTFDGSNISGWINSSYQLIKQTTFNTTAGVWYLGRRQQAGVGSTDSYMLEIIQYSGALSTQQRQQVEGYLAQKWGFLSSLPNTNPYITRPVVPFQASLTPFRGALNVWSPTQLSTLGIWFDFADRSTVTLAAGTNNITSYTNKGSLSLTTGVQAGTPTYGTATYNNLNLVQMPVGSALSFTVTIANQARTWFLVCRNTTQLNATTSFWGPMNQVTGGSQEQIYVAWSTGPVYSIVDGPSGVGFYIGANIANPFNVFQIYTMKVSAINSGNFLNAVNINGNPQVLIYNTKATAYGLTSKTYSLGTAGYNTGTDMGEALLYNQELTNIQVQQVEGYLAWKWGLQGSLPANHPFRLFPPSP